MLSNQESSAMSEVVANVIPIYVENGAYLNTTLPCLPNGIIDKTYTGIGGTSLELDCERDSIVVVPYNNIADAKVSKRSVTRNFLTHKFRKSRENSFNKGLSNYLTEIESLGQYIKIICVNDQLVNLKQELSAAGKNFENFFILFDEIDSMQEQSSFRSVMDNCMDIYLSHPIDMRAMITATLREFTHPELQNEPRYKVISKGRPKDHLEVIVTNSGKEELLFQIKAKMALDDKKVVVACNHIKSALEIAKTLEKSSAAATVGILCSPGSKKAVGELYRTLDENGNLPCKVNIITAAFFNGCDISERYHSIIYTSIRIASLQLSPSTIYQIAGRGRNGLESNLLIIQEGMRHDNYIYYSKEDLISIGNQNAKFSSALKLMVSELNTPIGIELAKGIHGILVEGFKSFPAVFRKINELTSEISYFKIDQRIIEQDTCALMENVPLYIEAINKIFQVTAQSPLYVNQKIAFEGVDKKDALTKIVNDLRDIHSSLTLPMSKDDLNRIRTSYKGLGLKELDFIMSAFELTIKHGWDITKLIEEVNACINAKMTLSQLKKLYGRLRWCSYNGSNKLQNVILKDFKIGYTYSLKELKKIEKECADRIEGHKAFNKIDYHDFRALLLATPSLIREVIFETTETKERVNEKHERKICINAFAQQLNPFL
jgi:hypothetical protein